MKKGLVTMADILGWKGIWQRRSGCSEEDDGNNHLENLIEIRKKIKKIALDQSAYEVYEHLVDGYSTLRFKKRIEIEKLPEIKDWAKEHIEEDEKNKVNEIFEKNVGNGQYDAFFESLQEQYPEHYCKFCDKPPIDRNIKHEHSKIINNIIGKEVDTVFKQSIDEISHDKSSKSENEHYLNLLKEVYVKEHLLKSTKKGFFRGENKNLEKEIKEILTNLSNVKKYNDLTYVLNEYSDFRYMDILRELLDEYIKKTALKYIVDEISKGIDDIYEKTAVWHNIDLLSDTFIICTSCKDDKIHLSVHGLICKSLIELCMSYKMLIRGATSYGEYKSQQSVFIGPAIDEAASWHEMAQEVSIFLSPSVVVCFKDKLKGELKDKDLFIEREMCFKSKRHKTYCVQWDDPYGQFIEIAKEESPMLPEFADKYTNTLKYLEEGNNEKDKKIDFSVTI